jgi:hypothetical protein
MITPASFRTDRWRDTVDHPSPAASTRSHTQCSLSDNRRTIVTRAGCPSALKTSDTGIARFGLGFLVLITVIYFALMRNCQDRVFCRLELFAILASDPRPQFRDHPRTKRLLSQFLCKSENQRVRGRFPDLHSKHPGDWNVDPESRLKTESRGGEGAKPLARLGYWPESKKPDAWGSRA